MKTGNNIKAIAIGVLIFAALIAAALLIAFGGKSEKRNFAAVEDSGILTDFARGNGEGMYLINKSAVIHEDAEVKAAKPYYVIALSRSDTFSMNEENEAFDHALSYAYTIDGKMKGKDAFASGTVAFVATDICQRQAYADEQGNKVWGERQKADVYLYDIATRTFFAKTTLYGAELTPTLTVDVSKGDFVHEVSRAQIEAFISGNA